MTDLPPNDLRAVARWLVLSARRKIRLAARRRLRRFLVRHGAPVPRGATLSGAQAYAYVLLRRRDPWDSSG